LEKAMQEREHRGEENRRPDPPAKPQPGPTSSTLIYVLGDAKLVIHDEVQVFEMTVELLTALSLIALILVMASSIIGSIVAALCAVRRRNSHVPKRTTPFATRSSLHKYFEKQDAIHNQ
jgi:hypothetical protein